MGLNIRTVEIIDSPNFYKKVLKPVAKKTNPLDYLGQSSRLTKVKMTPGRRESQVSFTSSAKRGKNEDGEMINQYVILKTLGKGSFATVLLCKDTISHEMFAVKKMNKKLLK